MYTTVLLAAMTVGSATPAFHLRGGCHGSYGGCSGGYGCSCYGCYGYGSAYGGWGCSCSCHGGYGGTGWGSATWWPGGYAGCYGPGYATGYGAGYGTPGGTLVCNGCYGCYGGHSCYGIPIVSPPTTPAVPAAPTIPAPPAPKAPPAAYAPQAPINPTPVAPEEAKVRSKVIIELPEDAKLFVDGHQMRTTSSRRVFQTPELSLTATYFYDIRIEVERNGKILVENQRIVVRPGREIVASFRDPAARPGVVTVRAE